jgi:hypothetical protein
MNRLLQQQQVMQNQMRDHQARMLAARERQMLAETWLTDQLRKAVPPDEKTARRKSPASSAHAAKRGWPATRLLFWLMALAVAARVLASL